MNKKEAMETIHLCDKEVEQNPNDPNVYFKRGEVRRVLENHQGAIHDFSKTIELNPNNAKAFLERAYEKSICDYEGAIEDCTKVLEIELANKYAFYLRGRNKFKINNYNGAIEDYTHALNIDPEAGLYYSLRADAKRELKDFQGAIQDYNTSINKNYLDDYRKRGDTKLELNDIKGAFADYDDAIKFTTRYDSFQGKKYLRLNKSNVQAFISRCKAYVLLKNFKSAFEDIQEASSMIGTELNNSDTEKIYKDEIIMIAYYFGLINFEFEKLEIALWHYDEAIKLSPNFFLAFEGRSALKDKLNDIQGAKEDIIKAGSLKKSPIERHLWDGCKCSKCGFTKDENHTWSKIDCSICTKCGIRKDINHIWDGCLCKICGVRKSFREEGHSWSACKCLKCDVIGELGHKWEGWICTNCFTNRDLPATLIQNESNNYSFFVDQRDGTKYKTVKIGNQIWMAENLNTACFRNGDLIKQLMNENEMDLIVNVEKPAWLYKNNQFLDPNIYGRTYNWYTIKDPRGLAPYGWHIPLCEEWEELFKSIYRDGNSLKAIGQGIQKNCEYDGRGTNKSGFSAILLGGSARFWVSQNGNTFPLRIIQLDDNHNKISDPNYGPKNFFSVRCIKD